MRTIAAGISVCGRCAQDLGAGFARAWNRGVLLFEQAFFCRRKFGSTRLQAASTCLSAATTVLLGAPAYAEPIKAIKGVEFKASDGSILIEDGDSFWIGIHRVRLPGIDTIEANHSCESKGKTVDCHAETMAYVTPLFKDPSLVCRPILGKNEKPKIDRGGRYVVIFDTKDGELNRKMIKDGWAVPDRDNAVPSFPTLEKAAKIMRSGLHGYTFKHSHDHRSPPKPAAACPTPT